MAKVSKVIPKQENETPLQRVVRLWLNHKGRDYENGWQGARKDLEHSGCSSGVVGMLIYYKDTTRFFRKHRVEISALLYEQLEQTDEGIAGLFGDKWDATDPLALEDFNQNLLAWFGFEETAQILCDRLDEEAQVQP